MSQQAEEPQHFHERFFDFLHKDAAKSKNLKTNLSILLGGDRQKLGRLFNNSIPENLMTLDEYNQFFKDVDKFGFFYTYQKMVQPILDKMIDFETQTVSEEFKNWLKTIPNESGIEGSAYHDMILESCKLSPQEFAGGIQNAFEVCFHDILRSIGEVNLEDPEDIGKSRIPGTLQKVQPETIDSPRKLEFMPWYMSSKAFEERINSFKLSHIKKFKKLTDELQYIQMYFNESEIEYFRHKPLFGEFTYYFLKKLLTTIHSVETTEKLTHEEKLELTGLKEKTEAIITEMEEINSFFSQAWDKIDTDFFKIEEQVGIEVPKELIDGGEYSRSLEYIANELKLSKSVVDAYITNVTNYGYEYADAIAMNDFINKIVDFPNSKLQPSFIEKIGGQDIYAQMVEKCRTTNNCTPQHAESIIANSFKNAVSTLFFAALTNYKNTLDRNATEIPILDAVIRAKVYYDVASRLKFIHSGLEPKIIEFKINMDDLNEKFDEFYSQFQDLTVYQLPPSLDPNDFEYQKLIKLYIIFIMKNEAFNKLKDKDSVLSLEEKQKNFQIINSANLLLIKLGYTLTPTESTQWNLLINQFETSLIDELTEFHHQFSNETAEEESSPSSGEPSKQIYKLMVMKNEASKKISTGNLSAEEQNNYFHLLTNANSLLNKIGYPLTSDDSKALVYLQSKQQTQLYKIAALGVLTISLAASLAVLLLTHGVSAPLVIPLISKQISAIVAICAIGGATLISSAGTIKERSDYKKRYHQIKNDTDASTENIVSPNEQFYNCEDEGEGEGRSGPRS